MPYSRHTCQSQHSIVHMFDAIQTCITKIASFIKQSYLFMKREAYEVGADPYL